MAKKAYIGVNNVARKIKKGYVGVSMEFPVYGDPVTTSVTVSNIDQFFTVTNGTYYFNGSSGTFVNTNSGVANSTAETTLTAKVDMDVSFYYSYASEDNYDKFTLVVGGTMVENGVSGASTTKKYSGSLKAGESIKFTYSKDGSKDSNGDRCAFSTINVTTTEVLGTETKGVARKIKKAYIGIGGVARPCWSSGELAFYGKVADLAALPSSASEYGSRAAVSLENHALFAGGGIRNAYAIDKTLTLSSLTNMSTIRVYSNGARAGNYAIIAGADKQSSQLQTYDVYNSDFTRSALNVGNYQRAVGASLPWGAVIAQSGRTTAYIIDKNLTVRSSSFSHSDLGNYYQVCAETTNRAIFAGKYGGYCSIAINSDGTGTAMNDLSNYKQYPLPASFMGRAFFAGGYNSKPSTYVYHDSVDMYDDDLTHSLIDPMVATKTGGTMTLLTGGTLENNLVFPGTKTTDVYDTDLVHRSFTSEVGFNGTAANVGQYLLFSRTSQSATEVYAYTE